MTTLDLTHRDFDTILAAMRADAATDPVLADVDLSDGAREARIMTALSRETAGLSHLLNNYVNEMFIARAVSRGAVIDHARGLGYELGGPTPSRITERLYVPRAYPSPVTIPAGTELQTDDGSIPFETDEAVVLPAFSTAVLVGATQGRTFREQSTGAAPDTAPNGQRFALAESGFVVGSDTVTVSGVAWARVANFLSSDAASRHYVVERDATERGTIVFGDGTNGFRPPEGAPIVARYRTCLGARGRVGRGRVTRVLGSFTAADGQSVDLLGTNPAASIGGDDPESLRHARVAAPASMRSGSLCVNREDFEFHASRVAGVARVRCVTHAVDPTVPILTHRLFVVPEGGGVATSTLLADVVRYIVEEVGTFDVALVEAFSAQYALHNVVATLEFYANFDRDQVIAAAVAAVQELFAITARIVLDDGTDGDYHLAFGEPVPRSQILGAIQRVPGVKSVIVISPTEDVVMSVGEFPKLAGTPTITGL